MTNEITAYDYEAALSRELLIVDAGVADADMLLTGLARPMEVVHLKAGSEPIAQIVRALSSHFGICKLHILAHGEPGALRLAGKWVDTAYLREHCEALATVKFSLMEQSEISLWACSVAGGIAGRKFVNTLASFTGSAVHASDRPVGAQAKGGDWKIGASSPFLKAIEAAWPHTLPVFDMDIGQSGAPFHTSFEEVVDGVTMTVTGSGLRSGHYSAAGLSDGYVLGNLSSGPSLTVSFDSPVNISSFIFAEYGGAQGGTYTFTVTNGTGSTVTLNSADIPTNGSVPNTQVSPSDWTSVSSFTVTSSNGSFQAVLDTINFSVPNDAPEFDDADDSVTLVVDEDAGATAIPGLAVTDANAGNTLTWSEDTGPGKGTVSISGTTSATGNAGDVPTSATYTPGANQTGSDSFTVQVSDGNGGTDTLTVNVTINAVDDAPTLSATGADATFTEAGSDVSLFSSVSASVVDSGQTFTGFTLAISGVTDGADEELNIDGGTLALEVGSSAINGITYSVTADGDDLLVTATGASLSDSAFADLLESISYENGSSTPTEADRTFTLSTVTDSGSDDNSTSPGISATVGVVGNDAPTVTTTSVNPTFDIGGDSVDLFSNVSASTNDAGQTFSTVTIIVNNLEDGADEVLHIDGVEVPLQAGSVNVNGQSFTVSLNSTQAVVTASGATYSEAELISLIDGMQYENTSASATEGDRRVIIHSVNDSGASDNSVSLQHTSTVTVATPNEAPTITLPSAPTVAEDSSDNAIGTITVADEDGDDQSVTITVTGGTATLGTTTDLTDLTGNGTGSISFGGNIDDINTALNSLTFTPEADHDGAASIQFEVSDGNGGNDDETLSFTVSPENDTPTGSLPDDVTVTEDTASNVDLSTADFGDVDSASITVTLSASEGTFASPANGAGVGSGVTATLVNSTTITLVGAPDDIDSYLDTASNIRYTGAENDAGDNAATISVSANDGDGSGTISLDTVNIDITAVNDAPVIGGTTSGSVTEDNDPATASDSLTVSDDDGSSEESFNTTLVSDPTYGAATIAANGDWTYTLDNDNATVDALGGDDTLSDSFTVETADGTDQVITLVINGANDAPTGSLPDDVTVTEDTASNVDLSTADFGDVDSASITVTLSASEGTFASPADGAGVGSGVTATLVNSTTITLVGAPDDIDSYLDTASNIRYTGAENDAGDNAATISVSANDGDGSGTISLDTVNIDITAVNDAPTITDSSSSVRQDATFTFSAADFNFEDVDNGDALAFVRIETLPTNGMLYLSDVAVSAGDVIAVADIGNFTFTSSDPGTTSFTYSVSDGTEFSASTADFSIRVQNINDAPTRPILTGNTVQENAVGAVIGTLDSRDPDRGDVTFSVSDDRFAVDGDELRLADGFSFDFEETPSAEVTVTAHEEDGLTTSRTFTITVLDVNEQNGSGHDDIITGLETEDDIQSGEGNDNISTAGGRDTIDGGDGDDTVSGGDDDDFLIGGSGTDMVDGGTGNDLVYAGRGDDGDDTVDGGDGNDTLGGGVGNDMIKGEDNDDLVWGRSGNDDIDGGAGEDMLYNGEGNDTVDGGAGDDTLWGGEGDDQLTGGNGSDTFIFGRIAGNDTVADFDPNEDALDLQYASASFASLDAVGDAASEVSLGDSSGLLINLGDGNSVFLVGISLDDLENMNILV